MGTSKVVGILFHVQKAKIKDEQFLWKKFRVHCHEQL